MATLPEAFTLAQQHYHAGRFHQAEALCRQILQGQPNHPDVLHLLGVTLHQQGKLREAVAQYLRALALKPAFAEAVNSLGVALKEQNWLEQAVARYRHALALKPAFAEAYTNLGNALTEQGKLDEGIAQYRHALALKPTDAVAHSNLLLCLHYHPAYDSATLFAHHRAWNEQHAGHLTATRVPHRNRRDRERPLRIGYVSPDFKRHHGDCLLEPVLTAHDHSQFAVYGYSMVVTADEITRRMQAHADEWREIGGMSDDDVAQLIRDDGIDILVDLSGHTDRNRLLVFARKPAPIQAAWVGYVDTTGLDAMDYRITDRFLSPPDGGQLFTEQLIHLPGALGYRPPDYAPPVSPCPAVLGGSLTYGCFNRLAKVHPGVIAIWSKILHRVPTARVVLKSHALDDPGTRDRYRMLFLEQGIAPERVDLLGWSPHADMLAQYSRVDIALDPFPFSGCWTTCEALWMGVPVITLGGATFVARQGVSLLSQVGSSELIADSPDHYVDLAVHLGQDPARLARLRADLRPRMATSPLCELTTLVRKLEQAYRTMWRQWCHGEVRGFRVG